MTPAARPACWSDATSRPTRRQHCRISIGTHGRDAEGRRGVQEGARHHARPRPARNGGNPMSRVKEVSAMSLSRRSFVQTLGVGATGLWIAVARPRGVALRAGSPARAGRPPPVDHPVQQREPARHPQGRARRRSAARFAEAGRYPFATAGEVTELSPRSTASSRRTCCSDRARRRSSAPPRTSSARRPRALVAADSGLRGVRRLRGADGPSDHRREAQPHRAQDGPRRPAAGLEGRRPGVLLQPEQPGRHRHHRLGYARPI